MLMTTSATAPSLQQIRVEAIVFGVVPSIATLVRLGIRVRLRNLWWDDAWALVALLCMALYMSGVLIYAAEPAHSSRTAKIVAVYMCTQFYSAVVWTSRQSILFTIVRLSFGTFRAGLLCVFWVFLGTWTVLFAQVWWVCEGDTSWKSLENPQCPLGKQVAVAQLVTDVVSDAVLVLAPLYLLAGVKNRALVIRVMAVFFTTVLSTAFSLYHGYEILTVGGTSEARAATFQCGTGLLVVNLSVLVAFVFRIKSQREHDTSQPITTIGSKRVRRRAQSTTIGPTSPQIGIDIDELTSRVAAHYVAETELGPTATDTEKPNVVVSTPMVEIWVGKTGESSFVPDHITFVNMSDESRTSIRTL
ncbi:hypothetical protein K488DRAFT_88037 [Vararia minispora EC-137]|uniref:Uncharacterized protein n=1 Tax=Vararia minispora EC-137 TaxID=1314806 RepID=A0ACB8QEC8_9AGAM|nr:hypothetical protein K488DRAFT_88037 [Vararia minispora EC-137]